jgi:hypothetical protein
VSQDSPAPALPRRRLVIEIELPDEGDEQDDTRSALLAARTLEKLADRMNMFGVLYKHIRLTDDNDAPVGFAMTVPLVVQAPTTAADVTAISVMLDDPFYPPADRIRAAREYLRLSAIFHNKRARKSES